jgi:O-antigen chain-terminating methyltransferase
MSDGFYRAFEDEHRGSRELIKSRQRVYLPFIQPLIGLYPDAAAIDLGCGRGEWLELLTESGFRAQGVDLDDGMLAVCRERNLSVQTKDAVTALKECGDESQTVVSGFHLAEHIPFEMLQTLVSESLRILKPGGLLILETPNPENIVVGTANFYLDPTHKQPIPPLLLSFLAEHLGFAQVKVIRLQGPVELSEGRKLTVHDVLGGVSPDYAIVAQKTVSEEIARDISWAFKPVYGVTLGMLAGAYDQQLDVRLANATSTANRAADLAQQAMSKAIYAENALNAIYASSSWRMTAPVRWLGNQRRLLRERGVVGRFRDLAKKICRPLLAVGIQYFDARPELRARHSGVAGKRGLYDQLRSLYLRISIEEDTGEQLVTTDSPYAPALTTTAPTQHAQEVHHQLKAAITRGKAER